LEEKPVVRRRKRRAPLEKKRLHPRVYGDRKSKERAVAEPEEPAGARFCTLTIGPGGDDRVDT
jgi:hypothetical protein